MPPISSGSETAGVSRSRHIASLLRVLQAATGPLVFNPWTQYDPSTDLAPTAPRARVARLAAHLAVDARFLLIGEGAGYQGCKVTGIAFTSERLILESAIPRVGSDGARLSMRARPWSEPSATTVWNTLHGLGIAAETVLWNAFPWHPHKPSLLHSNRTPAPAERAAGLPVLRQFLDLFPAAHVFAVGRNAEWSLEQLDRKATPLRHPSMGGALKFAAQLRAACAAHSERR